MTGYASGPVMVWELCNRPTRASLATEPVPGVCAMCGQAAAETVHVKHSIGGKSFTDQYLLARADSSRTCYGCAWVCTGKGMDQIRMWTVLARTGQRVPPSNPKAAFASDHVHFTSRADMRAVVAALADPPVGPWLVAVAESGQKHTVPYSAVNHGAGTWTVRMDACDITSTPAQFREVFGHVVALRAAGFASPAIETLSPPIGGITADTLPVWRHHAAALAPHRGSPLLHLAVFLPNKEHMDAYVTAYAAPGPGHPHRVGGAVPQHDPRLGLSGQARQVVLGSGQDGAGDGHVDGVLF